MTSDSTVSCHEIIASTTTVVTIWAAFCTVRVISSVTTAFVCSVSLRTRAIVWPAFVRVK
jgi:hypothetical protein